MGVLTRYLIRVHIGPFLFALSGITALIFLNSLSQRVGDLVGKGLHWTVVVEFLVLSLPHVVALALPMSVLVAVLYAFNDLASSHEITALSAGGIRPRQILLPVVGFGVVAAGFMYYFNDTVLPESNHALKNLILDINRKTPTLVLREQVVNELRPGTGSELYFLTADRIDHEANTLANVSIFDGNDPQRQRTTYADRGEMSFNSGRTDLYLTLYDGFVHEVESERPGGFQRLYFESQIIPLRSVGNELERRLGGSDRSDREMSIAMLSENADQRQVQLDSVRAESREESLKAVRRALAMPVDGDTTGVMRPTPSTGYTDPLIGVVAAGSRSRAARAVALEQTVNRYKVEIHKKLAIAFACLVFTLIGPPLALRFPRGGVGLVMAASSVIFSVYWVGLIAGESLADRRVADPAVTMWLSNVVFLLAGLVLASRMGRSAGHTRGGGRLDDLLARLSGRRQRPEQATAGAVPCSARSTGWWPGPSSSSGSPACSPCRRSSSSATSRRTWTSISTGG
ncbi:MAG TPA: LptF/LptG family permease [Longimicrobiales bacterium]|nr:LptF/LptG family permease [Longimicrobiales bacterium]